ncbi:MAG: 3'(2'),5'-bisphosphate nucleotidase CysQ [Hyphomicrobiales bacterium]|nr:3'(2'),5'-bisphosphate nucleotidase CysQ [Hyphomicrobiales bacterium]
MPDAERGLDDDLALLAETATAAGEVAMRFFRRDPTVWRKSGGSPVSEADLAVDRLVEERLRGARPDYGWLSEETADGPERLSRARVFVVDPIDGTRAFLRGEEDWSVSLAIVEAGRPVVAALLQPTTGALMTATLGGGAHCGGRRLGVSACATLSGARLGAPYKYLERREILDAGFAERRAVPSLALRIARVAEGRLDVAYGTGNAHDWDLAAADLLVHEAGGRFAIPSGEPLRYNLTDPRHPALVAATPAVFAEALRLAERLEP